MVPDVGLCSTSHSPVNLPTSGAGIGFCEKFTYRIGCYLAPMPGENSSEKISLLPVFETLIFHSLGIIFWWWSPIKCLLLTYDWLMFFFRYSHLPSRSTVLEPRVSFSMVLSFPGLNPGPGRLCRTVCTIDRTPFGCFVTCRTWGDHEISLSFSRSRSRQIV